MDENQVLNFKSLTNTRKGYPADLLFCTKFTVIQCNQRLSNYEQK